MEDLDELLALADRLAGEAAALSLERLGELRTDVRTKSSTTDMVSEVDEACETLIVDGIRAARPDDGVLSEEGANAESTTGVRWVIDPIDGTTNYLYGHPGYGSRSRSRSTARWWSASSTIRSTPSASTPCAAAARPETAPRSPSPPRPSSARRWWRRALATTPISESRQAERLARLIGSIRDIRRMGAAAVDLCSVACGRVDAYYERGLNHWDLAAGALIATEAGATTGELDDGTVIAAPPALYGPLRQLLAELPAGEV